MKKTRILLLVVVVLFIVAFFLFDLGQYLTLEYLKEKQSVIDGYTAANPLTAGFIFFLVYVLVTGLSLPGAAILTLTAGAIFGLVWGTVIASFASAIGATIAFLAARFLFRDIIQQRFSSRLATINKGVEEDGPFYLFILRLVPVFPFFVINLLMALTPMPVAAFYLVSQIGMLAGTIVYVNAGTQIARISELGDILSPQLIGSFVLLGVFPLIAKKVASFIKARRHLPEKINNDDG